MDTNPTEDMQNDDGFLWNYTALTNVEPHTKKTGQISASTMLEAVENLQAKGLFPVVISLPIKIRAEAQARAGVLATIDDLKRRISIEDGSLVELFEDK
jgi:hypothetical protein